MLGDENPERARKACVLCLRPQYGLDELSLRYPPLKRYFPYELPELGLKRQACGMPGYDDLAMVKDAHGLRLR